MTKALKAGMYTQFETPAEEPSPTGPVTNMFERIRIPDGKILDIPKVEYVVFLEKQILELSKKVSKQEIQISKLIADMKRTQAAVRKIDRNVGNKVDRT